MKISNELSEVEISVLNTYYSNHKEILKKK